MPYHSTMLLRSTRQGSAGLQQLRRPRRSSLIVLLPSMVRSTERNTDVAQWTKTLHKESSAHFCLGDFLYHCFVIERLPLFIFIFLKLFSFVQDFN